MERRRYTISDDTVAAIAHAVHEVEKSDKTGHDALRYLASLLRESIARPADPLVSDEDCQEIAKLEPTVSNYIANESARPDGNATLNDTSSSKHLSTRDVHQQDVLSNDEIGKEFKNTTTESLKHDPSSHLNDDTSTHSDGFASEDPSGIVIENVKPDVVVPNISSDVDNLPLTESLPTIPKNHIVLIIGGPGSGKGTVCCRLVSDFGFAHLSVGELLREEVAAQSALGLEAASIMNAGQLVPDELVLNIVQSQLSNLNTSVLLDGFPRTLRQAELFTVSPSLILWLNCEDDILINRILERAKHSGRDDDNLETVTQRIKTFKENANQIVDFYKEKGHFVTIDGSRSIDEVYANVEESIQSNLIL
jgi:adenylate kinase family enzyme